MPSTSMNMKQSSLLEPSSASVHSENDLGDSVGPTPAKLEDPAILAHSVRTYTLQERDKEQTSGLSRSGPSPSKNEASPQSHTAGGTSGFVSASHGAQYQGNAQSAIPKQPPPSSWQNPSVMFAMQSNEADPFFVGHSGISTPIEGVHVLTVIGHENGTAGGSGSQTAEETSSTFRPREDREVGEISGDNAQAIFSPSACVFVANLAATSTDELLEHDVSRVFEQFGKVYAKIKRDSRGMPYAFCQYENEKDAEKAITLGHGLSIQGRACRTERARVNRSLYLSRTSGGPIAESDARAILAGYGPLEKLWISGPTDREMFRLPEGIWVTFAFFQDCRDAQAAFKDNSDYRLEQPALPDEIRQRVDRSKLSPFARSSPLRGRLSSPVTLYSNRHASSSVFVGNLPVNASLGHLRDHFIGCGSIKAIEIVAKANPHTPGHSIFAFVEFCSDAEAKKAVAYDAPFDGRRLRVELRESQDHPFARANINSGGSPRGRGSGSAASLRSSGGLEAAMTRALALGVPVATAMQIFDPQSMESTDNLPQTPLLTPYYPGVQYYSSPYPQYSPYGGAASASDAGNANVTMYSPMGSAPSNVPQYPCGSIMSAHYSPGYQLPQYIYPSVAGEHSNNHKIGNQVAVHGEQTQS